MCHIYIVICRHTSGFSLKTPHMLSQLTVNSCNFHSYATVPLHTWPQCCSLSKENQLSDSDYFIFQMVQTTSELPSCGFSDLKRRNNLVTLDWGAPGRGRALSDRFHTFTCCCEQWLWSPPVVLPQAKVLLSVFIRDKEFPAYCQQPFFGYIGQMQNEIMWMTFPYKSSQFILQVKAGIWWCGGRAVWQVWQCDIFHPLLCNILLWKAQMFKPEVTVKTKTNPFSSTNVKCQRSGPVIIIPCCWLPLQFPLGQWTSPWSWGLSLTPKGQTGALKRNSGSIIITMGTLVSWELFCVGLSGMSAVRFVLDPSEHLEHWQKGRWQKNCAVFC